METAAIYCRLSEEDRNKLHKTDDSNSIQNQKTMLLQYAAQHNWEIYDIYSDDDYTGSDRNRPQFQRLLQDARQRKFTIILCKTQSRFTRELELVETYIHGLFPLWGIRFISIVDHGDTANKGNKKARQINGLVNEWYLEDMSENIRSVLTSRRKNGFHIGSFALYGYQKDPNHKGRLIIDPEAAEVVREVFLLFSQGYGKTAIARLLNNRGIPNPTEYKRRKGLRYKPPSSKNSTLWKYSSIAHMLKNEIYIGNMVQGKYESASYKTKQNRPRPEEQWYRVSGTHEAIIDQALWSQVQELLQTRTKSMQTGSVGLFARKVRCAGCGYIMRSTRSHSQQYLICSTRHASKDACVGACICVQKLEKMVIAEWTRLTQQHLDQEQFFSQIQPGDHWKKEHTRLMHLSVQYEHQIEEYAQSIRSAYLDKVRGILSQQEHVEILKNFISEKTRLEASLAQLRQQINDLHRHVHDEIDRESLLLRYVQPSKLNREMVNLLIDHILVEKRIPGTRNVPITIHWRF